MTRQRPRHKFTGATHVIARPHQHTWTETERTGTASGEITITEHCTCGRRRTHLEDRDNDRNDQ